MFTWDGPGKLNGTGELASILAKMILDVEDKLEVAVNIWYGNYLLEDVSSDDVTKQVIGGPSIPSVILLLRYLETVILNFKL